MLYRNTSYLANPTTPHGVPVMVNITFDVSSVVINVTANTICCFSVFCRNETLILTIFIATSCKSPHETYRRKFIFFDRLAKLGTNEIQVERVEKTRRNYDGIC